MKQEIDLLPKDRRKEEFRKRKTSMEVEHEEREKQFLASLSEQHEIALRRISEIYREKMAATEKSYLQQKQTVRKLSKPLEFVTHQSFLLGNENPRGDDVGAGRETHPRKAPTIEATCEGALLHATPSNDHQTRKRIGSDQEVSFN